ncbi:MAG: SUF system Fe-S cluster assembly protein [Ignavibacteria bacterium]|nr:MAG: SUF system Fe-S cluster assembly protein [Ignavibacteria bacterium]
MQEIDDNVIQTIKSCYDPEIPVNIYELGLIYQVRVAGNGKVTIKMTLTSPNCPAAQSLPAEVKEKVSQINDVSGVDVDIVWDPPWSPARMSEAARLELGMM